MPGAAAYSHRDRRAHRAVDRVLGAVVAAVVALTALAMVAPGPWIGLAAVVGLLALGGGCVAWGNDIVDRYARDLRATAEGAGADGFLRAEVASSVGLAERPAGAPSPHRRPRRPLLDRDEAEPASPTASTRDPPAGGP